MKKKNDAEMIWAEMARRKKQFHAEPLLEKDVNTLAKDAGWQS